MSALQRPLLDLSGMNYDQADFEARVEDEYLLLKAREEARRRVEVERSAEVDLDALFLDRDQLDELSVPTYLIPGVIPRHAYGVLRGRDQSFKSFVALDWSLTIASGGFWDMAPVEQARVLYIAGEGAWGLRQRLAAWEERRGARIDPKRFTVRQVALNLHRPGPAFEHLLAHVEERRYDLVVVDTLRRVSGAADGNSSEMGAVVDNLDQIKHATADGSVLVVAHTDKGDSDSRGYSGIEDDADFVWHARREGLDLDLELTKMKDGPDGRHVYLRAWPVLDSLVLAPATRTAEPDRDSASEIALLGLLHQSFPDGTHGGILRDASGMPKATFYRVLANLVQRGRVLKTGSQQRPFYTPADLAGPTEVSSPIDARSHGVSPESQRVPRVSRPLGSETSETHTGSETAATAGAAGESPRPVPPLAALAGELSDEQRALLGRLAPTNEEA
ncbi:AAA family ATPase [Nocardioides sp. QY071]|uniref:AAA family ATPase n=1 Tax=Nocardioides sp. QY071 TaxID=3044187 RepID=UPI00249A523A|nr:AAA family ATPase [Nocardioides sp. QY071]WGY03720.1 AAA family ATPase [Nocardioides sp. QY071]